MAVAQASMVRAVAKVSVVMMALVMAKAVMAAAKAVAILVAKVSPEVARIPVARGRAAVAACEVALEKVAVTMVTVSVEHSNDRPKLAARSGIDFYRQCSRRVCLRWKMCLTHLTSAKADQTQTAPRGHG